MKKPYEKKYPVNCAACPEVIYVTMTQADSAKHGTSQFHCTKCMGNMMYGKPKLKD